MASTAMENSQTNPDSGFEHVERTANHGEAGQRQDQVSSSPQPRRTTTTRPRPLSMPPVASVAPPASSEPASHSRAPQEHRQQDYHASRRGGSRPVVRVVGNYSLGKTVGAGSMGKVKIAYHNITGEKVSRHCATRPNARSYSPFSSSRLKLSLVPPVSVHPTLRLRPSRQSKPLRMHRKRSGPSARRLSLCCFSIHTSVV